MTVAALLIAGVCSVPPLFDMTGPTCSPADQLVECRCSECFAWDPVPDTWWYDVHRVDQDGTIHDVIGSTESYAAFVDEDGNTHPRWTPNLWCVGKDGSTPIEGRRYVYSVRACDADGCSIWSQETVTYVGALYACYSGPGRVPCPIIP